MRTTSQRVSVAVLSRKGLAVELSAATSFAALTALGARVQFHLPFTPVPVTGQVFCVLLAGAVLGARLGFLSQLQYLAAGAAGLPIFAHGGGPAALLGPTGGYLAAFPIAALIVGALSGSAGFSLPENRASTPARRLKPALPACLSGVASRVRVFAACLCGVGVIYLFGASWFAVWRVCTGAGAGLLPVLAQSVFPFVGIDVVKAALVAAVAPAVRRLTPIA